MQFVSREDPEIEDEEFWMVDRYIEPRSGIWVEFLSEGAREDAAKAAGEGGAFSLISIFLHILPSYCSEG